MTSPDDYAQRLKVAGQAVGTSNPQLAHTLATSGLSQTEIQAIGGFTSALNTNTANALAQDSGVQTNWSAQEQNGADAIGTQLVPPPQHQSWLESLGGTLANAVSNGGNFLFHNPVTHAVMTGLDWIGNVAHMPVRVLSAAIGGEDETARNAEMQAYGYDPASTTSQLAFMFSHGDSEYHDLSHVRRTYGDELVDLAVKMQADPEQFQKDLQQMEPTAAGDLQEKLNSEDFKQASMAVDARHISPGRDLANILLSPFGVHSENNGVFRWISGVTDAAYDWFSDPTLILGRVSQGMRAANALGEASDSMNLTTRLMTKIAGSDSALGDFVQRRAGGIKNALDQTGIYKVLGVDSGTKQIVTDTQIGRGWQAFADRAATIREQTAIIKSGTASAEAKDAAKIQRAVTLAEMQRSTPTLMPLLDEINGARVVGPVNPEFAKGLADKVESEALTAAHSDVAARTAAYNELDPAARAGSYEEAALDEAHTRVGELTPAEAPKHDRVVTDRSGQQWYVVDSKPLETLPEIADYLSSTAGLLRLNHGEAAAENMVMPGRVSWWTEQMAIRKGNKAEKWLNYVDDWHKIMPVDEELPALSKLDPAEADMSERARLGQIQHNLLRSGTADGEGFNPIRRARMRMERVNRRISTILPDVKQFDLTDATTTRDVEQFARFYLDKGQAKMIAAAYAAGDLGTRRQVVRGMVRQSMSAAGLDRTPAGRKFMDDYIRDVDQQQYGLADTDIVQGDRGRFHAALSYSQLSTSVPMPSLKQMNQMAVRFAVDSWAAKTGMTAGMGALQSNRVDALYGHIKMGWITSAAGGLRNALDEVTGYLAKGMGRQILQGRYAYTKATEAERARRVEARQAYKDLQGQYGTIGANDYIAQTSHDASQGLNAATRAYDRQVANMVAGKGDQSALDAATDALGAAQKDAAHARLLESAIQHKIPYGFRRTADSINHVLVQVALGKVLRVLGPKWQVDEDAIKHALELRNETLRPILADGVQQTHYADNYGAIAGPEYAMAAHRDGVMARRYSYKSAGWGTIEPDGGQGMDSWSKFLGLHFSDPREASHEWLAAYKASGGDVQAARDAVRAHLDTETMREFINQAEVMKVLHDGTPVTTPALLAQAKDQLADRISTNLHLGLASRETGEVSKELIKALSQSKEIGTPDASWLLHNVAEDERPAQTIGQLWSVYNPTHVPGQMPTGYAALMSKAYGKVVTDYVDAASRNPLVTALYMNARRNTEPWEKFLVEEQGWSEEAAAEVAQRMSLSHAEQESYKHIDNPHVASQFSLISRNFLTFERAQEDWLRRWSRAIKDNPAIIRKGQLALHAGTSTGMVEKDPTTGQLNFVYPGSHLAIQAFNGLMRGMGLGDQVQIPVLGELTSQLTYLSPSLAQPFGTSASPIISLPFKALTATVGQDHALLMADLDTILNGQMGAGQNWYSMILPPSVNRIIRGVIQSDPASQYGQAYANGVMALGATGYFDKLDGTDPTAIENTSQALGAQVRNNLALNILFGFFAPAAPAVNFDSHSKAGSGSTADWSAHMAGMKSLKEEAQQALSDLGPTRFRLWWAATHPNELIWDPTSGMSSKTKTGTANAYLPATIQSALWYENNQAFLKKYGGPDGVGAYFVPSTQNIVGYDGDGNAIIGPDTTGENSYNQIAFRAQLQDHMRSYKDLSEYIPDLVVKRGEAEYYKAKDESDSAIEAAKNAGDLYQVRQLTDAWSKEKAEIYARNPLLAQKNAANATNGSVQGVAVANLRRLVDDPDPAVTNAIGGLRQGVQIMLSALDQYNADDTALAGRVGPAATVARNQLKDTYATQIAAVTRQFPDLADLAKGVFRTP